MNEVMTHPWAFWLSLAIVAAILEMIVGSFSFVFVCVASVITAFFASCCGWEVQLVIFGITLLMSLGLIRPRLLAQLQSDNKMPSRAEILVGKLGKVTQAINPVEGSGRIETEGQDWAAQSSEPIAVGASVKILGFDGIVLLVQEV